MNAAPEPCPTCGRPLPGAPVALSRVTNVAMAHGRSVALSVVEARILDLFLRRRALSHEQFRAALWAETPAGGANANAPSVHVSKLRRKLAPLGLSIICHRGAGYELSIDIEGECR